MSLHEKGKYKTIVLSDHIFVGEKRVLLFRRVKMILENKLNFLSTKVHCKLFVNTNSHWIEGVSCVWDVLNKR